jgi:hypothetical protein
VQRWGLKQPNTNIMLGTQTAQHQYHAQHTLVTAPSGILFTLHQIAPFIFSRHCGNWRYFNCSSSYSSRLSTAEHLPGTHQYPTPQGEASKKPQIRGRD